MIFKFKEEKKPNRGKIWYVSDYILKNGSEEEIDKVTTPKGCTISGLNEMEHRGFSSSLIKGILNSFT